MNAPPLPARSRRSGPRFLGRYEVIGELARGGMGSVYLARHAGEAGFQRLFAVKVLHPHLVEEAGFVDMLRDEARIAALIHHPNVVAVVDIGTQGESPYIVMDYVEGPSFATLCKRSRENLPLDLVLTVMVDTLEGLHAAHTLTDEDGEPLHLVHRDVSPQNVLVGVDGVARITDFGIAKAESRISSTQPGTRKGKLQFMSPEQIKDAGKIDLRTDIWAAGVVLYGLLTGEHLFRDENDAATVHNVISKEVPAPSSRGPKIPDAFDAIVLRAVDRDQSKRFDSALEMADALRKAATQANLLGSRQGVARWVTTTFAEELELRRGAIRDVARRRSGASELRDYSQVIVLPSLPSSTEHPMPDGTSTPPTGHTGSFIGGPPSTAMGSTPPQPIEITMLPPDLSRRKMQIGIAVAGAFLFGLVGFLLRSPKTVPPVKDSPAVVASAAVAAAPSPPTPSAVASAEPEAEPSASAKSDDSEKTDSDKKTGHWRRVVGRPVAVRSETSVREFPAPSKAEPASAPVTSFPTAAPQADFEKNPYLRH